MFCLYDYFYAQGFFVPYFLFSQLYHYLLMWLFHCDLYYNGLSECVCVCVCVCVCALSVISDSLQPHGLQPTKLLCPWNFPGKNTAVYCKFLLQGIFQTQGSNSPLLRLLRWQVGSLPVEATGETHFPARSYNGMSCASFRMFVLLIFKFFFIFLCVNVWSYI